MQRFVPCLNKFNCSTKNESSKSKLDWVNDYYPIGKYTMKNIVSNQYQIEYINYDDKTELKKLKEQIRLEEEIRKSKIENTENEDEFSDESDTESDDDYSSYDYDW